MNPPMELFNVSVATTSRVSSRVSFVSPKPSIQFRGNTNTYRFRKSNFINPYPSRTHFPAPHCKGFYISAQFGRRSIRRNSLRRKLSEDLQVLRKNPQDPNFEHDDANTQSNLGGNVKEAACEGDEISEIHSGLESSAGGKGAGESVLWNKLEGWVEQYKNDIELWGIGSGSIFSVYQELDGKVKKILVDEDEIVRRSGIQPSGFRVSRESDEFDEVRSKIAYARFVADEMEKGNHLLSKSSSVAKFLISEDDSKLVTNTRSDLLGSKSSFIPIVSTGTMSSFLGSKSKFVPIVLKLGIVPLCGLLLVWGVKKFFSMSEGEKELTRLEKEMLRRKVKSRTGRVEDGCVEVVPEVILPANEFVERPSLDKEELMNSIKAAVKPSNQMGVLDVAGLNDTASMNMEGKIQEIRDMARHAREVEKNGNLPNEISVESEDTEFVERLSLGKDELMNDIKVAIQPNNQMGVLDVAGISDIASMNMEWKIQKIGDMGRHAREVEKNGNLPYEISVESEDTIIAEDRGAENGNSLERKASEGSLTPLETTNGSSNIRGQSSLSKEVCRKKPRVIRSVSEAREYLSGKYNPESINGGSVDSHLQEGSNTNAITGEDTKVTSDHMSLRSGDHILSDALALSGSSNTEASKKDSSNHEESHSSFHPRINGMNGKAQSLSVQSASALAPEKGGRSNVDTTKDVLEEGKISDTLVPEGSIQTSRPTLDKETCQDHSDAVKSTSAHIASCDENTIFGSSQSSDPKEIVSDMVKAANSSEKHPIQAQLDGHYISDRSYGVNKSISDNTSEVPQDCEEKLKIETSKSEDNWLEKNFDELLPVLERMGTEFSNSYSVAREKVKLELDHGSDLTELRSVLNGNTELEWMNDDKLREVVFKVRDNELAGRDPFHSVDDEDKATFFQGLEEKVERESGKLSALHEWLHSNIENLDYGADGISVYDPPEKVVPRWKGAPFEKICEFLANGPESQEASSLDKANGFLPDKNLPVKSNIRSNNEKAHTDVAKRSKTVIESSDGAVRAGKRTGKEQWQHTKKHTRGFLESYNAETDPEIKDIMKDMGKDLDRWITEEEIKKAANLKEKMRRRGKAFVEKKLNKIRSEVEQFGTQAVLSKYREYAVEKEEDYLWWLDLPYVLCIELYTHQGEEVKVGFYTLEMAADLELDPKPHHVIAFEEPGDCKNLCYIIQSHFEMLGKGDKAFVVAQPPKEAFRDAKANGFGVTVIRRGELPLNVDQPLEEVEELVSEIGSKMYHDKITKERSIDIRSVMKGVLATSKPGKRKNMKRRRKKPKK